MSTGGQTFELDKFNVQPPIRRLLHYIKNEKPYFQESLAAKLIYVKMIPHH